jgi:hypothetical protein
MLKSHIPFRWNVTGTTPDKGASFYETSCVQEEEEENPFQVPTITEPLGYTHKQKRTLSITVQQIDLLQ